MNNESQVEAKASRPSLRQAINNQCKQCVAPDSGHWRKEVEGCQGYSCPLYQVRPLPIGSHRIPVEQVEA